MAEYDWGSGFIDRSLQGASHLQAARSLWRESMVRRGQGGKFARLSDTEKLAEQALKDAKAHGGFTRSIKRGVGDPKKGFAVSHRGKTGFATIEGTFDKDGNVTKEARDAYVGWIRKNKYDLKKAGHLGGWYEDEPEVGPPRFHFDVTDVINDEAKAVRLGTERDQVAIFNLETFEEIKTGGVGDPWDPKSPRLLQNKQPNRPRSQRNR